MSREARCLVSGPNVNTILHLGGALSRVGVTALFAGINQPRAHVIISSESHPHVVIYAMDYAGVMRSRLELDYAAADTLENFTATRARVLALGTRNLYVVTSAHPDSRADRRDHMGRAFRIFQWVYRGTGVVFLPVGDYTPLTPESQARETWWSHARDAFRAAVWYYTGWVIPLVGGRRVRARMRGYAAEASRILGYPDAPTAVPTLATATLRRDGVAIGVHLGTFTPADRDHHLETCDARFPLGAPHRVVDLVARDEAAAP